MIDFGVRDAKEKLCKLFRKNLKATKNIKKSSAKNNYPSL